MSERHISYFQSVITLGILSHGETSEEASKKAKEKMKDSEGVNYCFFEQTPFESVATEKWTPEIESEEGHKGNGLRFNFDPSDETKNVIATRLQKDVSVLTKEDYEAFVKDSLEKALAIS